MKTETITEIVLITSLGLNLFTIGTLVVINNTIKSLWFHQKAAGDLITEMAKNAKLTATHFDLQARATQLFLEKFLGKNFNVQCNFIASKGYVLYIWKRYETRDMGVQIESVDQAGMLEDFMNMYYKI